MATKSLPPTKTLGDQGVAQLVSSVPSIAGTEAYDVWRGPKESLATWSATVLARYPAKRVRASVSINGGIAELTITDTGSGEDGGEGGQNTTDDARTPTLTISMSAYARPIETLKSPTNFASIAVSKIAEIRKWVRTGDKARLDGLMKTGKAEEQAYARLYASGITTRADPCFQAEATRYIRLDKNFAVTVGDPGAIVSWGEVVSWLGNAKGKYADPSGSLKWRATGVTVAVREGQWAEVSKTFEGAEWWPEELYG